MLRVLSSCLRARRLKAEYLYADFGKEDFTSTNPGRPDQTHKHSFDLDMPIIRVGLIAS
jgi:hypothetical protein